MKLDHQNELDRDIHASTINKPYGPAVDRLAVKRHYLWGLLADQAGEGLINIPSHLELVDAIKIGTNEIPRRY